VDPAAAPTAPSVGKPLSAMDRRALYFDDVRKMGFEGQRLPDETKWSLDRSVQLRGGKNAE
jgi:hypothetical protein